MPLSKCAGQNKGFGWNGDPEANHRTKKKRYNSLLELKSSASAGPLQAGMTIGLKGGKNKLWCADDAGGVVCNRDQLNGWEQFTVEDAGGGMFALRGGRSKKYCADEQDKLICDRDHIKGWEKFTVEDKGGGAIVLKGGRANQWCADEGNKVLCNRNGVGGWEIFTVKIVKAPKAPKAPEAPEAEEDATTDNGVSSAPKVVLSRGMATTCKHARVGTKCAIDCLPGYAISGNSASQCKVDPSNPLQGFYQGHSSTCVPVPTTTTTEKPGLCPKPDNLKEGVTTACPEGGTVGTACEFGCDDGYAPSGATTSTCTKMAKGTAEFIGHTIECKAAVCSEPAPLQTGMTTTCKGGEALKTGCEFACEDGYTVSGEASSTCSPDKGKSSASYQGHTIKCAPKKCLEPTHLSPGVTTTCKGGEKVGASCEFGCEDGFILSGKVESQCLPEVGKTTVAYHGHSVSCKLVATTTTTTTTTTAPAAPQVCPAPTNLAKGVTTTCKAGGTLQSSCKFGCANGFILLGETGSECLSQVGKLTAAYQGHSVTCDPAKCQAPVERTGETVSSPKNCPDEDNWDVDSGKDANVDGDKSTDLRGCESAKNDIRHKLVEMNMCKCECAREPQCVAVVFHKWGTMLKKLAPGTSKPKLIEAPDYVSWTKVIDEPTPIKVEEPVTEGCPEHEWDQLENTNVNGDGQTDLRGCESAKGDIRDKKEDMDKCKCECARDDGCKAVVFHEWGTMLKKSAETSTRTNFVSWVKKPTKPTKPTPSGDGEISGDGSEDEPIVDTPEGVAALSCGKSAISRVEIEFPPMSEKIALKKNYEQDAPANFKSIAPQLHAIVALIKRCPNMRLAFSGHSCSTLKLGDRCWSATHTTLSKRAFGYKISLSRAAWVANWFVGAAKSDAQLIRAGGAWAKCKHNRVNPYSTSYTLPAPCKAVDSIEGNGGDKPVLLKSGKINSRHSRRVEINLIAQPTGTRRRLLGYKPAKKVDKKKVDKPGKGPTGRVSKITSKATPPPAHLSPDMLPPGVKTTCKNGGAIGTQCSFSCGEGLTLSGETKATCLADAGSSTASYQGFSVKCEPASTNKSSKTIAGTTTTTTPDKVCCKRTGVKGKLRIACRTGDTEVPLSKCAGQNKDSGWSGDPEANHQTKKKPRRYDNFISLSKKKTSDTIREMRFPEKKETAMDDPCFEDGSCPPPTLLELSEEERVGPPKEDALPTGWRVVGKTKGEHKRGEPQCLAPTKK